MLQRKEDILRYAIERNFMVSDSNNKYGITQRLLDLMTEVTRRNSKLQAMGPIVRLKKIYLQNRNNLSIEGEYPFEHMYPYTVLEQYEDINKDYKLYGGFDGPEERNNVCVCEYDILTYPQEVFLIKDYLLGVFSPC